MATIVGGGFLTIVGLSMFACNHIPATGGIEDGKLARCPGQPNCVCSDDPRDAFAIAPLTFGDVPPATAWQTLKQVLGAAARTEVTAEEGNYLHAVATTRWLRFRDDLEFQLRAEERIIAVRSSSRVGHSDLGVNRKRLEAIRVAFAGAIAAH